MHAAIGAQAEKVQLCAALLAAVHGRIERGIFKKVTIVYGLGYARKLLVNYPARAKVKMANLAVAHLPFRQANGKAACGYLRMRIFVPKLCYVFHAVRLYGVIFALLPYAEARCV